MANFSTDLRITSLCWDFLRNPDVSTTYPAKKQHLELSEEEPLLHQHGGSLSNSFCPRGPVAIVFYFAQLGLYEDAPVLPWYFPKNTEDWRPEKAFGKDWVQGLLTRAFNIKHYALKRIAPAVIHPLIHFQLSPISKVYTEKIRYGPQARPWDMAVGSNHVLGFLKELQLLRGFWRNL